jgi:hypothetical protein
MNDIRTLFQKPHIQRNPLTGKWSVKVYTKTGQPAFANPAIWYLYNLLWDVSATKSFVARLNENKGD